MGQAVEGEQRVERSVRKETDKEKESKDNTAEGKLLAFGQPRELSAQYLLPKENRLAQAIRYIDRMDFIAGI